MEQTHRCGECNTPLYPQTAKVAVGGRLICGDCMYRKQRELAELRASSAVRHGR